MRRSPLRLYGPFLAIIAVQGLLMALAPSRAPDRTTTFGGTAAADQTGGDTATASTIDPATGLPTGTAVGSATGSPAAGSGAAAASGGGATPGPTSGPTSGPTAAAGDTSHCVGDRQFEILLNNPRCIPKFTGDNGGATYPGVTADSVKVVIFETEPNEAVNAVLAPQGLASTNEEQQAMYDAGIEFIHAHYELYGRRIELIRYQGPCPTSPPDVPACLEAAREVVRMQPFIVVFGTPLYDRVFDEFSRAGIISIGGWHFDESYFTSEGRRGLRYDLFMDGTRSAEMIAEYYCKKLAGGTATRAGTVIHPTIGGRETRRRLGISVPAIDANVRTAEHLAALVQQCDPTAAPPVIQTYVSDIERAAEQTNTTTLRYINDKVTTVVCMCDPVAPAFGTRGYTQQGYFPEILMPGLGLLDFDKLGRLYDPQQMVHAFGFGHLAEPIPFGETDAARVWRATGRSGQPCQSCNLFWGYTTFVGSMIMAAGPNLNPATVEQGILTSESYGGDKVGTQRIEFGPGDYTALSDAREIYWCGTCTSRIDGQAGAYVSPNNARRYRLGEWTAGLDQIPQAPS